MLKFKDAMEFGAAATTKAVTELRTPAVGLGRVGPGQDSSAGKASKEDSRGDKSLKLHCDEARLS